MGNIAKALERAQYLAPAVNGIKSYLQNKEQERIKAELVEAQRRYVNEIQNVPRTQELKRRNEIPDLYPEYNMNNSIPEKAPAEAILNDTQKTELLNNINQKQDSWTIPNNYNELKANYDKGNETKDVVQDQYNKEWSVYKTIPLAPQAIDNNLDKAKLNYLAEISRITGQPLPDEYLSQLDKTKRSIPTQYKELSEGQALYAIDGQGNAKEILKNEKQPKEEQNRFFKETLFNDETKQYESAIVTVNNKGEKINQKWLGKTYQENKKDSGNSGNNNNGGNGNFNGNLDEGTMFDVAMLPIQALQTKLQDGTKYDPAENMTVTLWKDVYENLAKAGVKRLYDDLRNKKITDKTTAYNVLGKLQEQGQITENQKVLVVESLYLDQLLNGKK